MSIIRIEKDKNNPYVMISREPLQNTELSWKAKGLLSYLLSLPDDWKVNIADLKNRAKDGRDSAANTLKELITAGYVVRDDVRDSGKFDGYDYTVYEYPPGTEKPYTDKPNTENPTLVNKHSTNNTKNVTKVTVMGKDFPLKELQIKYNPILTRTIINIAGFKTNLNNNSKVMRSVYHNLVLLEHNKFIESIDITEASTKGKMLHNIDTSRIERISGNMKRLENILKKAAREYKYRKEERKQFLMPDSTPALSDFFYSEKNSNSWFLHCACCEPMVKNNWQSDKVLTNLIKSIEKDIPNLKELVGKIYNNTSMKEWDSSDKTTFYSCIKNLIQWRIDNRTELSEKNDGWRTHFGTNRFMFATIGYFLDECFPRPVPKFLEINGRNWKQFSAWVLNSYDVNLYVKEKK